MDTEFIYASYSKIVDIILQEAMYPNAYTPHLSQVNWALKA